MDLGSAATRVAVASAGTIHLGFRSSLDAAAAGNRIDDVTTASASVQSLIEFARDVVLDPANGARADHPTTVVLLVEGDVTDGDGNTAAAQLQLTESGLELTRLIVVGKNAAGAGLAALTNGDGDAYAVESWADAIEMFSLSGAFSQDPSLCADTEVTPNGCRSCTCDPEGGTSLICDADTGACPCKTHVVGADCDACADGYSELAGANPVGCSGTPAVVQANVRQLPNYRILVSWTQAGAEDGPLIGYAVLRGSGTGALETVYDSANVGNVAVIDEGAVANRSYSYTVRASTAGGHSLSIPVYIAVVYEVPPFAAPPTVTDVTATAMTAGWVKPGPASLAIEVYTVTVTGPDDAAVSSTELAGGVTSLALENLAPYTVYAVTVRACVAEICATSAASSVRTPPTASGSIDAPVLEAGENGTGLAVSWSAPASQNGVLLQYQVQYRQHGASEDETRACTNVGRGTSCIIAGLTPRTRYDVRIVVFNRPPVLETTSSASSVGLTSDGLPSGVQALALAGTAATAVAVVVFVPADANGDITSYVILVDGEVWATVDAAGRHVVDGLTPYTSYELAVQACTSGGCTTSSAVTADTNPAAPSGQGAPVVTALPFSGSTRVSLQWQYPQAPNGIITQFRVERQRITAPQSEVAVIATLDASGTPEDMSYADASGLSAFTSYSYRIVAVNPQGEGSSSETEIVTAERQPEGLAAPSVLVTGATSIAVSWAAPDSPNGALIQYQVLLRNASSSRWAAYTGRLTQTSVDGLLPSMEYEVAVSFTNSIGTVYSAVARATTDQAQPDPFETTLSVEDRGSTTLSVAWIAQQRINGDLTAGSIGMMQVGDSDSTVEVDLGTLGIEGNQILTELEPNLEYAVWLSLCTQAGCTRSDAVTASTLGRAPDAVSDLTVRPLSDSEVQLLWSDPASPNQPIGVYQVWRDTTRVFTGSIALLRARFQNSQGKNLYVDRNLQPSTRYRYSIRTFNDAGFSASQSVPVATPRETPSNIRTPVLSALSSTAIQATWSDHPLADTENLEYTLIMMRTAPAESDLSACAADTGSSCTLENLSPAERVSFQMKICVVGGTCGYSSVTTALTDEATPAGIQSPEWSQTEGTTLSVSWDPPTSPNGNVSYELWMQGEFDSNEYPDRAALVASTAALNRTDLLDTENHASTLPISDSNVVTFDGASSTLVLQHDASVGQNFTIASEFIQSADSSGGEFLFEKTDQLGRIFYCLFIQSNGRPYFYYRAVGSPSVRTVRFTETLTRGERYQVMLTVTGTVARLLVNGQSRSPMRLAGLVDDCGAASSECIVQLGSRPVNTLLSRPASSFFAGSIFSLMLFTAEALTEFPNSTDFGLLQELNLPRSFASNPTKLVYTGTSTEIDVGSLFASEPYLLRLQAATGPGLINGSLLKAVTIDGTPQGVSAPVVSTQSHVVLRLTWDEPERLNGDLVRYVLEQKRATDLEGFSIYSSSDPDARTRVVPGLRPNTPYDYRIVATTSVGSAASTWTRGRTAETSPQGVDGGNVADLTPTSFTIAWNRPAQPNGRILTYNVFVNDSFLVSVAGTYDEASDQMAARQSATLDDLRMAQTYRVVLQACTSVGCTSSTTQTVVTPLGSPQPVTIRAARVTPRLLTVAWVSTVTTDRYILLRRLPGDARATVLGDTLRFSTSSAVFNDPDLRPGQEYEYQVIGLNALGQGSSDWYTFETRRIAPIGVSALHVALTSPRSADLSWSAPAESWSGELTYQVMLHEEGATARQLYMGTDTGITVDSLFPATQQNFTLVTCVDGDLCTSSSAVAATTDEAAPDGFTAIRVSDITARTVTISWDVPERNNGMLREYVVSSQESGAVGRDYRVDASELSVDLDGLSPHAEYTFFVAACTAAGCTRSSEVQATMGQAAPEGQEAPSLVPLIGGEAVLVRWVPPTHTNGVLQGYSVEYRKVAGSRMRRQDDTTESPDTGDGGEDDTAGGDDFGGDDFGGGGDEDDTAGGGDQDDAGGGGEDDTAGGDDGGGGGEDDTAGDDSADTTQAAETTEGTVTTSSPTAGPSTAPTIPPTTVPPTPAPTSLPSALPTPAPTDSPTPTTTRTTSTTTTSTTQTETSTTTTSSTTTTWLDPYAIRRLPAGMDLQLIVEELDGNTWYEFRVVAESGAGESVTEFATIMTLEAIPNRLARPELVQRLGDTQVELNITAPRSPNGVITGYWVIHRVGEEGAFVEVPASGPGFINVTDLFPGVTYLFSTKVCTVEGCAISPPLALMTAEEANPEGVPEPTVGRSSSSSITFVWDAPTLPHGRILRYEFVSNDGTGNSVVTITERVVTLNGYRPYQSINARIRACNSVGCGAGPWQTFTTLEIAPAGVAVPIAVALFGGRTASVAWTSPSTPNGEVTYAVLANGTELYNGPELEVTVSGLSPLSAFAIVIRASTAGGWTDSVATRIFTGEGSPEAPLAAPAVDIVSSTRVQVSWATPEQPNGVLALYQVLRDGVAIYSSNVTTLMAHDDIGLTPDTTYVYSYVAGTAGGNTTSIEQSITTFIATPELLPEPSCTSLSSSEILVVWDHPVRPNGAITNYSLFGVDEETDALTRLGMAANADTTQFAAQDLEGFKSHTFIYQACINSGCAVSEPCGSTTLRGVPSEVSVPSTTAINTTTIQLSWDPPGRPNAELVSYQVHFRVVPDDSSDAGDFALLHEGATNVRTAYHTGLGIYTAVEYTLTVFNSVGNTTSSIAVGLSGEAAPEGIEVPVFGSIESTSARASWEPPAIPNGEVTYVLRGVTDGVVPVIITTTETEATVEGLLPVTSYAFILTASTSAGSIQSESVSIETAEGAPTGVSAPELDVVNGSTVLVSWGVSASQNGVLSGHGVLVWLLGRDQSEAEEVCVGFAWNCNVTGLDSYTQYNFAVRSCTQGGCATGPIRNVRTGEAIPEGFASPEILYIRHDRLTVAWTPPEQPYGVITHYLVYRVDDNDVVSVEDVAGNTNSMLSASFSGEPFARVLANETVLQVTDTNRSAFTTYNYAVSASNGAGAVFSAVTSQRTRAAAPSAAQELAADAETSESVVVSWAPPANRNGNVLLYEVLWRPDPSEVDDDEESSDSGSGDDVDYGRSGLLEYLEVLRYTIENLRPHVVYIFEVQSSNRVGFSSAEVTNRTCSSTPSSPLNVTAIAMGPRGITANWLPSTTLNGHLVRYIVVVSGVASNAARLLQRNISNLQPYTQYEVAVRTCVTGVCGQLRCSENNTVVFVNTSASAPEGMQAPAAEAFGPRSVDIAWQPPALPNGRILFYTLYQGGAVVYNGTSVTFRDTDFLQPGETYEYRVRVTAQGGQAMSTSVSVTTPLHAPEGVQPPEARVVSSNRIVVSWTPPQTPNGRIIRYNVVRDGNMAWTGQQRVASLTEDIRANQEYELHVEACILVGDEVGCGRSESVFITTPCAGPATLTLSVVDAQSRTITLGWSSPERLNCDDVTYAVQFAESSTNPAPLGRSQAVTLTSDSDPLIPNEVAIDSLTPAREYVFRLLARNALSSHEGPWIAAATVAAAPGGVPIPSLVSSRLGFVISWDAPGQPNGDILVYNLYQNDVRIRNTTTRVAQVGGLVPLQMYAYTLEACNAAGCTMGDAVQGSVAVVALEFLALPELASIGADQAVVQWTPQPADFVLRIKSCVVDVRGAAVCFGAPVTIEHVTGTPAAITLGSDVLSPGATYEVQLVATNAGGETRSAWLQFTTHTAIAVIGDLTCAPMLANPEVYVCDLSGTFAPMADINSILIEWMNVEEDADSSTAEQGEITVTRRGDQFALTAVQIIGLILGEQYTVTATAASAYQTAVTTTTIDVAPVVAITSTSTVGERTSPESEVVLADAAIAETDVVSSADLGVWIAAVFVLLLLLAVGITMRRAEQLPAKSVAGMPMPLRVSTTDPFWITEEDATEHLPIIMHQLPASIPPSMERTATATADDRARLKEMASLRQGAQLAPSSSPAVTRPLVGEFPRVKHFRNPLKPQPAVEEPMAYQFPPPFVPEEGDDERTSFAYQFPPPFVPEEGDDEKRTSFADHVPKMEWSDEEEEVIVEEDPAVLRARVVHRLIQHVDALVTDRYSNPAVDDLPKAVQNDVIADVLDERMAVLDKGDSGTMSRDGLVTTLDRGETGWIAVGEFTLLVKRIIQNDEEPPEDLSKMRSSIGRLSSTRVSSFKKKERGKRPTSAVEDGEELNDDEGQDAPVIKPSKYVEPDPVGVVLDFEIAASDTSVPVGQRALNHPEPQARQHVQITHPSQNTQGGAPEPAAPAVAATRSEPTIVDPSGSTAAELAEEARLEKLAQSREAAERRREEQDATQKETALANRAQVEADKRQRLEEAAAAKLAADEEAAQRKSEDVARRQAEDEAKAAAVKPPSVVIDDPADGGLEEVDPMITKWEENETLRTERRIMASDMGQKVKVKGYESEGTIKYFGPHKKDPSKTRIGVELSTAEGKNSGTIKGDKYFDSKPKHGVFVTTTKVNLVRRKRPEGITVDEVVAHNPSDLSENEVKVTMDNSGGLGIKFVGPTESDEVSLSKGNWVTGVREGSVAATTGKIKAGMNIKSVNGLDVTSMAKRDVVQIIKAAGSVTVVLKFDPVGYQLVEDSGSEYKSALARLRDNAISKVTAFKAAGRRGTADLSPGVQRRVKSLRKGATKTSTSDLKPTAEKTGNYSSMGRLAIIKVLRGRQVEYSSISKDRDALAKLAEETDPAYAGPAPASEEAVAVAAAAAATQRADSAAAANKQAAKEKEAAEAKRADEAKASEKPNDDPPVLEETIQRAEEHAVSAVDPGFVHPSQIETDEGAEDEIPAWRKKELEQKEQEMEVFIKEQETSRSPQRGINRHKAKHRSSKQLKKKGEDLVAKLEALPDESESEPEPDQHVASVLVDYDNNDYLAKRQSAMAAAEAAAEEEDPYAVPMLARSDSTGSSKAPKIASRAGATAPAAESIYLEPTLTGNTGNTAAAAEQPMYGNVAAAEPAPEQPVYENTAAATKPAEASEPEQPLYENTAAATKPAEASEPEQPLYENNAASGVMPTRGSIRLPKLKREDYTAKAEVSADGRFLSESEIQSKSVDTAASAARLDDVVFDFNFG